MILLDVACNSGDYFSLVFTLITYFRRIVQVLHAPFGTIMLRILFLVQLELSTQFCLDMNLKLFARF